MDLAKLASAPQLVEVEINDSAEVAEYKVEAKHTYDKQLKEKLITKKEYTDLISQVDEQTSIVDEYGNGEPLTFKTKDRLPIHTFMKLADANEENIGEMIDIIKPLVLNEQGKPIIQGDVTLPNRVLIAVVKKITERLGK